MDDSTEIWKAISGFEGMYEVSTFGRVRRIRVKKGLYRYLHPFLNRVGYLSVFLYKDKVRTRNTVHYFVTFAFLGARSPGLQVNHKDGDKTNNRLDNLEYITAKENQQHSLRLGLFGYGEKKMNAKLTDKKVIEIRMRHAAGSDSKRSLAKEFGVSQRCIQSVLKYLSWRHVQMPPTAGG